MERSVEVATGESVAFSYELAGLGSRFFAVAIDFSIQILVLVTAVVLITVLALQFGGSAKTEHIPASAVAKFAGAVLAGIGIFSIFMLFFGYFIIFEWRFAGRTPGKRLLGIRVVRDGGFPLDFTSAVVRNVVRILEFGIGLYAFSALSTLLSPMNRRFGDMAAGTLVVREGRFERAATLAEIDERLNRDDGLVRELTEPERDIVRRYVERRATLTTKARTTLAARIASAVRPKLGAEFAHLDDDALLVHVAESSL